MAYQTVMGPEDGQKGWREGKVSSAGRQGGGEGGVLNQERRLSGGALRELSDSLLVTLNQEIQRQASICVTNMSTSRYSPQRH